MVNILTIIPARSGSKSILQKNIKKLNNHPLMSYSIKYSLKSKLVTKTIVSTDSLEFSEIAKEYGAAVPFIRPLSLAGDDIQDFPVLEHGLLECEKYYGIQFEYVVWLRPTSPLRPSGLIEKGIDLMEKFPESTSLRSVVESSEHPYRQWEMCGDYMIGMFKDKGETYNLPRQQLPKVYFQSGDIEIVKRTTVLNGSMSGEVVLPLVIDRNEMIDIDHISDFLLAEKALNEFCK